ncbi:MAG: hypothetical protein EBZ48_08970 [Proteobacteria bacterium]|nr:hypothetical protein [Pseudomonadota bacterium]
MIPCLVDERAQGACRGRRQRSFLMESNLAMEMKDIQTILQMLKENEIHEFELEHAGTRIKIARGQVVTTVVSQPHLAAPMQPAVASVAVTPASSASF